jgi:hypothetical protein
MHPAGCAGEPWILKLETSRWGIRGFFGQQAIVFRSGIRDVDRDSEGARTDWQIEPVWPVSPDNPVTDKWWGEGTQGW